MTFDQIVSQAAERLNIVGTDGTARIGRSVNAYYKRVTSSLGIATARRTVVQATATPGVDTLAFAVTKLNHVEDRTTTPPTLLDEVSNEEIAEGSQGTTPTAYAIYSTTSTTVTIRMNAIPATAIVLYAEGLAAAATLATTDEPAFDQDFHDLLVSAAVYEERLKMEKTQLAMIAKAEYEDRLGDLRLSIAKTAQQDIYQGKRPSTTTAGASGSGSSAFNGAQSWTQTGLITFNRQPSLPPFAITAPSAKVTNLDADKLDGTDWTNQTTMPALVISAAAVTSGVLATARGGTSVDIASAALPLGSGQITFPSTQNPSSNANTLDDYEEGSWTPVLGGNSGTSGQSYAVQLGTYTKVGKLVSISFYVLLTNKGTITGTVQISGLPFAADSGVSYAAVSIGNWVALSTNWVFLAGYIASSASVIVVDGIQTAGVSHFNLTTTDISSNTQLIGSATYRASA